MAIATVFGDHAAAIGVTFGLGTPIGEMRMAARGEQGQVWRLDTDRGTYAVKQLLRRQTEREAAEDVAYQAAVLATAAVSMPKPVCTVGGDVLAPVGTDQARVYEWVDVLAPDLDLDAELVGATVAAIHRVPHDLARPFDDWYTSPVGAARWSELSDALRAAGAPFADVFDAEIPMLLDLEHLIEPATRLQVCHRDLWSDNMLPTPSGSVCVVDWENCGLADPNQEMAMPLVDFAYRDSQRASALWSAYIGAGGTARLSNRGSFSMVIAQFGHFFEMAAEHWLDPASTDATRQRAISRIDEAVDRPFSVDIIDEILEAVHS